jgi:hypothetical protein
MANKNVTRAGDAHQKKTLSLFCVAIGVDSADTFNDASDNYLVGYLPPNAVITAAYVNTKVISDAATVTVGTTEGGTEILSAGTTAAVGINGTFTGRSDTGTGVPIHVTLGAVVTTGDVRVVIEYDEYELNTGEMTKIDNI